MKGAPPKGKGKGKGLPPAPPRGKRGQMPPMGRIPAGIPASVPGGMPMGYKKGGVVKKGC